HFCVRPIFYRSACCFGRRGRVARSLPHCVAHAAATSSARVDARNVNGGEVPAQGRRRRAHSTVIFASRTTVNVTEWLGKLCAAATPPTARATGAGITPIVGLMDVLPEAWPRALASAREQTLSVFLPGELGAGWPR